MSARPRSARSRRTSRPRRPTSRERAWGRLLRAGFSFPGTASLVERPQRPDRSSVSRPRYAVARTTLARERPWATAIRRRREHLDRRSARASGRATRTPRRRLRKDIRVRTERRRRSCRLLGLQQTQPRPRLRALRLRRKQRARLRHQARQTATQAGTRPRSDPRSGLPRSGERCARASVDAVPRHAIRHCLHGAAQAAHGRSEDVVARADFGLPNGKTERAACE